MNKWFKPGTPMNWHHSDSKERRRRNALRAHGGDRLATARALNQLANVTRVGVVEKAARSDAKHFFAIYKEKGNK